MRRNQPHTIDSPAKSVPISFITGIVACLCIAVYLGSMVIAGIKVYTGIAERRILAAKEFSDLLELASALGVSADPEPFRRTVTNEVVKSSTLQGVIIGGANRTYTFERNEGTAIVWNGEVPAFKTRFGLSKRPLVKQIEVSDELRQVQRLIVSAVYTYIGDDVLLTILKRTLLIVVITLCLALFTLIFQFVLANPIAAGEKEPPEPVRNEPPPPAEEPLAPVSSITPPPSFVPAEVQPPAAAPPKELKDTLKRIGQEAQTEERLTAELKRCSSFGQDVVFMLIELHETEKAGEKGYRLLEEETVKFFLRRDLIFEQGQRGIAVILPSTDLDQGFAKSEQFYNRILDKYAEIFETKAEMYIGLSSRADRAIDGERLIFEAAGALRKAWDDPTSPIVAFRSDPEKYKAFIDAQNRSRA